MTDDETKYLIIGNSTAAIGAVEGIRRVDVETPVLLVSKEPCHTYSRPLISYLLAGDVDEEQMYYRPRDFYERHRVRAVLGVEVVGLDPEGHTVTVSGGGTIAFEKLLIATGGRPFMPPIEGWDNKGVFTFTSWEDAKAVAAYASERSARAAVVVGAGLIGVKAAEALRTMGLGVTVVELAKRPLPLVLDLKAAEMAVRAFADAGVGLACGTSVERVLSSHGRVRGAVLSSGGEIPCDIVIVAAGVVPNMGFLHGTSIRTDRGILIDECCRTSDEDIYAAGDVAQAVDALTGQSRPIPIFPGAYRQGAAAGVNMAGGRARAEALFAMNSVEVFGLPTISVGLAAAEGDGYEVLSRADGQGRAYRRIVMRNGRVVGALFVGDIDRAGIVTGLIREGIDCSGIKELILSDDFGLLSLPADYRKHVVRGEGIEV